MRGQSTDIKSGELTPRVIALEMCHQFMKNYSYLVVDPSGRQAVVVDPAWQMEKIDDALTNVGARLSGILITHSHPDHVHLAEPLASKHDCPIWMSREEAAASGFDAKQLICIEETRLTVGQMTIEAILTPGHTPGCMCYLIGANLFTGDVLFAEGCGICPDMDAAYAMFASLDILKASIKPQTRIYPGHSYGKPPGQTLSQLLRDNMYLQFSNRESFAAFRLRNGQNLAKMFSFR